MLPLRFVGLLVLLLAVQGWCKPAKSSEGEDYNDDDPPSDYNDDDTVDDVDDAGAFEEPPAIMSRPESIQVRNGSTISLPCLLRNADSFAVTWKKDDEFLFYDSNPMKKDYRMVRLPNNTLVIHNVTANDTSNSYECSILIEPPLTIKHRVLVYSERGPISPSPTQPHKEPPIRVTPGKKVEIKAGKNLTLGCETNIEPTPEIKWYYENERIHNHTISGNHITITNITKHNGGRYQCLAENGSDNPPVEAINVVVNYAPEIETKGKSVHTGLGVESWLTCIVHAHPHAKVVWLKDEEEVVPKKGSIEIKGNKTKHVLEILHTEKEHFGNYTCVAENKVGRAEKTISLTGNFLVPLKRRFESLPSQAIISGGEMARTATGFILKWQLESYSPITEYKLKYRRKGEETWITLKPAVTNGKGNQFIVEHTIEGLQPGSYEAILMARNDFGWSTPSKPHTFIGEYEDEQAENVKGSPSSASHPALAIATLFLVVSSCAFRSL
ncbi:PREDICTED: neurotrimin-like isoform X1 [Habropoda laboriosa]|uniref:neurotrimin-like isoform X1 n=1 Tax=Habropoda laboriosa TaxID=597456 RepID=UPI00083D64DA|nr:PREDICTED: neurotrimin-like isoform X1 [Habropoda laboriosa]XP_017794441.1 PREDICTED: neurotrimin-like isoform X1 [Habropoda laboriosa]